MRNWIAKRHVPHIRVSNSFFKHSFVSSWVSLDRRAAIRAMRSFELLDIYRPCVGGHNVFNSKGHSGSRFGQAPALPHDSWVQTSSCFFRAFIKVTWLLSRVLALKSKVLLSTSVVYSARAMFVVFTWTCSTANSKVL